MPVDPKKSIESKVNKDLVDNYGSFFKILDLLPDPYLYFNRSQIYKIFRMMRVNDGHIVACLKQRISRTTMKKWSIEPASESSQDLKIAQEVKAQIESLQPSDLFRMFLVAIPDGYTVLEVIWDLLPDGSFNIKELKQKFPEIFGFNSSSELLLKNKIYAPDINSDKDMYINLSQKYPGKFVVHTNQEEFSDPRGSSLMASCFWAWTMKKAGLVFWQTMLDKYGTPSLAALMKGSGNVDNKDDQRQSIADELVQLHNGSGAAFTDVDSIQVLEVNGSGTDFGAFVNFLNNEISKAILTETLTVETQGTGSFALGEIHFEELGIVAIEDAKSLQNTIDDTIIKWFVELNYGEGVALPKFLFDLADKASIDNVFKAIELGIPIKLSSLITDYHLPIALEGDTPVEIPEKEQQFSSKKKILNPYIDSLL